jgi:hypothetical protein
LSSNQSTTLIWNCLFFGSPLAKDGVGYRQVALHLSEAELDLLTESINKALKPFLKNKPSKQRQRFLLSSILIPGD